MGQNQGSLVSGGHETRLPDPEGTGGPDLGSNLKRDKRYDQILHMPRHTAAFSDRGGVLDIYGDGFRPLFPDAAFAGFTDPDDFTDEISDHLPLWMQVETRRDEEWPDQFL